MAEDPTTLADALGFRENYAKPLEARLEEMAESWKLPGKTLRRSAVGRVIDRVEEVFGVPVHRVLAAAWRRHPACRAYCDPVKYPHGESHTMELAEHSLTWACEPAVEVLVEGLDAVGAGAIANLAFAVDVEVGIKAGLLTIQDARFMRMDAMDLVIRGELRVEQFSVAKHEVPLRLPGTVRFGAEGEPICPEPERAAAPPTQVAVPNIVEAPASV